MESDSKQIIDDIKGKTSGCFWKIKPIIDGIREKKKGIQEVKVNFVKQKAKTVALEIAQQTVRRMCPEGWVDQPPFSFVYVLCNDRLPAPHSV